MSLREFVAGLVPNAVVSVELPLPAASEKPPPRWALNAIWPWWP